MVLRVGGLPCIPTSKCLLMHSVGDEGNTRGANYLSWLTQVQVEERT